MATSAVDDLDLYLRENPDTPAVKQLVNRLRECRTERLKLYTVLDAISAGDYLPPGGPAPCKCPQAAKAAILRA